MNNLIDVERKLHEIKAADIMSRFAITTTQDTTIADLAHVLMRFKISGVPVVNSDKEDIGIVTATDLFEMMKKTVRDIENKTNLSDFNEVFVKDIMTEDVFSVSEETSIFDIIKLMCEKNIHTLPVVTNEEIVGVIGRRDVINAFYSLYNENQK